MSKLLNKVPIGLADLERVEGGYRISAYYLPDLETRESVAVVITLANKDDRPMGFIDSIVVPANEGWDVFHHPAMHSDSFRLLLAETAEMARR